MKKIEFRTKPGKNCKWKCIKNFYRVDFVGHNFY